MAATVHIVSSGQSKSYETALQAIQKNLKAHSPQLSVTTTALTQFSPVNLAEDDLIITLGNEAIQSISQQVSNLPVIHSFAEVNDLPSSAGNWAAAVISQPLLTMLKVMDPLLANQYKNELLIAYSASNQTIRQQVASNAKLTHGMVSAIPINEGDKPAKYIEDKLFKAGALVSVNDSQVWRGENARWMLYQAYRYKVPVVGYSKKFLKAGALVSVYSTVEQIALKTAQLVQEWESSHQLAKKGIFYANYNIEFNRNIARALNMDVPDDKFDIEPTE